MDEDELSDEDMHDDEEWFNNEIQISLNNILPNKHKNFDNIINNNIYC